MCPAASFAISCPTAVHFGLGASDSLPAYLPANGGAIAFVRGKSGTASAGIADMLARNGHRLTEVQCPGEPSVTSLNTALRDLSGREIQAVVACGGGSVIDMGKALAFCLSHDLTLDEDFTKIPRELLGRANGIACIALPTTAGTGAEVTANAVLELPSSQRKVSLRGRALAASVALVDPHLMMSAPAHVVLNAGLDAIVQTIESFTSARATPFTDGLTGPNIEAGLRALPSVLDGGGAQGWVTMAWVSLASGLALANSGLGAAHGLASVIGGRFPAPHGAVCGRLLIPVLRQNRTRTPIGSEARTKIDRCIDLIDIVYPPAAAGDRLSGLETWLAGNGLPRLGAYGITARDIDEVAAQAVSASSSRKNAVPLQERDFRIILDAAL